MSLIWVFYHFSSPFFVLSPSFSNSLSFPLFFSLLSILHLSRLFHLVLSQSPYLSPSSLPPLPLSVLTHSLSSSPFPHSLPNLHPSPLLPPSFSFSFLSSLHTYLLPTVPPSPPSLSHSLPPYFTPSLSSDNYTTTPTCITPSSDLHHCHTNPSSLIITPPPRHTCSTYMYLIPRSIS